MLLGVCMIATVLTATAQETKKDKSGIKRPNVGVSFNMNDFDKETLFPKEDSAYGFSVMFWKGITPKIDYSILYNGISPGNVSK
jgi:hypothetical protein